MSFDFSSTSALTADGITWTSDGGGNAVYTTTNSVNTATGGMTISTGAAGTSTSGNIDITTGTGGTSGDITLEMGDATSNEGELYIKRAGSTVLTIDGQLKLGANANGYDLLVYGQNSGDQLFWDESASKLTINGVDGTIAMEVVDGEFVVGSSGAGDDVTFYSDTAANYMDWTGSSATPRLTVRGSASTQSFRVDSGTAYFAESVTVITTLTTGTASNGQDVRFYGTTSSDNEVLWDASANKLSIDGIDGTTAFQVEDGRSLFGTNGNGDLAYFYSDTSGRYMLWDGDQTNPKLQIIGQTGQTALHVDVGEAVFDEAVTFNEPINLYKETSSSAPSCTSGDLLLKTYNTDYLCYCNSGNSWRCLTATTSTWSA